MHLVLASASPRRRDVLSALRVPFTVTVPDIEEEKLRSQTEQPEDLVVALALSKAQAVRQRYSEALVISADTLVWLDDEVLGKPKGRDDARRMLLALRGRRHKVITGLALVPGDSSAPLVRYATTTVTMRRYSEAEVDRYIASGDPLDKAGAYAVQNAEFHPAARVDGCYFNVVGLPPCVVVEMFSQVGVKTRPDVKVISTCRYRSCPLQPR